MLFGPLLSRNSKRSTMSVDETLNQRRVMAGGTVVTPKMSIQRVAVFAAANLIASLISQLPLDPFKGQGKTKKEIAKPLLYSDPGGEGYGFEDWAWTVLFRGLIQGNAVGLITSRDTYGFPETIQLQDIDHVRAGYKDGKIWWKIHGRDARTEDVWHFRAYPQEGEVLGLSPIGLHMRTVGVGIQAEEFGQGFFTSGGHPTAILSAEGKLDPTKTAIIKSRFMAASRGSREPVVLPSEVKYQAIQINPQESQFLETLKYSSAECARIFGVGVAEMLGYETGSKLTYVNVEQRSIQMLVYTFNSWVRRFEQSLSGPKMTPRGQYCRFNRKALLQATTLDRYKAYEVALRNNFQVVNEVRELEDWQPVEWGNEPNVAAPPVVAEPDDTEPALPDDGGK